MASMWVCVCVTVYEFGGLHFTSDSDWLRSPRLFHILHAQHQIFFSTKISFQQNFFSQQFFFQQKIAWKFYWRWERVGWINVFSFIDLRRPKVSRRLTSVLLKVLLRLAMIASKQQGAVHVMALCRQAASHNLSQCWPYGVTRPKWLICYNWA